MELLRKIVARVHARRQRRRAIRSVYYGSKPRGVPSNQWPPLLFKEGTYKNLHRYFPRP
jgi:hypothetical protein